jgi:tight adherence protein B
MQLLILGLVFVAVFAVTLAGWQFMNRRRLSASRNAREQLAGRTIAVSAASILKENKASDSVVLERMLRGRALTGRLQLLIERAGKDTNPGAILTLAAALIPVTYLLFSTIWAPVAGVLGALVAPAVPFLWLSSETKKRRLKMEEQLPDALDMLVNAMRAGYSFQHAMRFIGEEMDAPLGPEFLRFYEEQRLGMDVRDALLALQSRVDGMDMKMFVTAVLIQRETGGNLSEVLGNIGAVMRERFRIRGEIQTLTAQGKMSAKIMSALPVLVYFATSALNPKYMNDMRAAPIGVFMLVAAAVLAVVGYIAMMKLADVEV